MKRDSRKRPLILLGAGGHGRVLIDCLKLTGEEILATYERKDEESVFNFDPREVLLVNGVGSIHVPVERRDLFLRFKERGYFFDTVIHPSAVMARDVVIGEGAQIMAGAVVQTGSRIGENTIINTRVSVDHDCDIGSHVHVAPGAVLSGGVKIGDTTHIGTGAIIVQGVRLGKGGFVPAARRVSRNEPDGFDLSAVPLEASLRPGAGEHLEL